MKRNDKILRYEGLN
ncbi:hypothetical protein NOR68_000477 [Escherichia coli]|nr:hypothetical protein [Escherichia coli]